MTDVLVATGMVDAVEGVRLSILRRSRDKTASSFTHKLTPTASAVLAAVPACWKVQPEAVGIGGKWVNVAKTFDAIPSKDFSSDSSMRGS
ncbi:hypothetical protein [Kocuria sp. ICS0012]|uniref:hypothetical protein n=1 Tax=Kocuria sp. ICS0012 TaxID=1834155 RepID=UPI000AA92940|nr:hypothetical protein [Kocuria sp. ICS0012]